jgi:hypothetical protein
MSNRTDIDIMSNITDDVPDYCNVITPPIEFMSNRTDISCGGDEWR